VSYPLAVDVAFIARRLDAYERLVRLDKPIGALLLLWPTLWALWLASGGTPRAHILLIFVMGTWLMRSAGCAINDYADRDIDPHVERTRSRPLAAREIEPWEALALAAAHDRHGVALAVVGDEELEPDAEDERDPQKRRQGREHQASLDLGQQRG